MTGRRAPSLRPSPLTSICFAAGLAAQACALAQTKPNQTPAAPATTSTAAPAAPATPLQRVEVEGAALSDVRARRDFVAGKIVISRREIDGSGLTTVQELLKREPTVTIGVDGRPGLLGLPGYTQVLVDGKPAPPGRPPHETDLVHVERIEIVKGSLAEFGPFGIAGTINIVTRQPDRKPTASLRLNGSLGPAVAGTNIAWSDTWRPEKSPWTFSARLSASKRDEDKPQVAHTFRFPIYEAPPTLADQSDTRVESGLTTLNASGTIGYKHSETDQLTLSPAVNLWRTSEDALERHSFVNPLDPRLDARSTASGRLFVASMPLSWRHQSAGGSRVEVEFSPTRMHLRREGVRDDVVDLDSPAPGIRRERALTQRHASDSLRIDVSPNLAEAHSIRLGASLGHSAQTASIDNTIDGLPDPAFATFGRGQSIRGPRHSAYVQDEWKISKQWAATAGISAEWRRQRIDDGGIEAVSSYRVASPSLHVAHKLDAAGTRRLRLSAARSFRAPETEQLLPRPVIHPLAPCSVVTGCGTNSFDRADVAGNPALRPERSAGLTASLEQDFGKDSMVGLDLFQRRLTDVIGEVVAIERVTWAPVPRVVIRPDNLGTAWTRGASLDARLNTADVVAGWPKVELRAGASVAASRLQTVPGPDNHMADQSPWSAKLGAKYKLSSIPLELGMDASWRPGLWYRTAVDRRLYQGRRQDYAVQAAWTVNPAMKLRMNATNLFARDLVRGDVFGPGARQDVSVWTQRDIAPTLSVTLEMKV